MSSHNIPITTLPRLCTKTPSGVQPNCNEPLKMAPNTAATNIVIALPGTRTVTVHEPAHTKQVGSVPAFGDGKGAATITSSRPLREPKPTAIRKPVEARDDTALTRQVGSVPAFGDGSGAATLTSSDTFAEPEPTTSQSIGQRNAWVQNASPTKVAQWSTLTAVARVHRARDVYPRSVTLQNGDVTIQTAPSDPESTGIFDPGLFPPETATFDTRVIPAEISVTLNTVHRQNHTLGVHTHRKNDTEHRTHHRFNQTKTITEDFTMTQEVTKTITTFPQLRTHNLSRPLTLPGTVPSLDSHYTEMTYHHEDVSRPTQNAAFGSFQPAIPGVSHHPVSSQASHNASIPSFAVVFYTILVGIMLITAFAHYVHFIVTGEVEDEPLDAELDKKAVKKIKKYVEIEERRGKEALARSKARAQQCERELADKESQRVAADQAFADKDWEASQRACAAAKSEFEARELARRNREESQKQAAHDAKAKKILARHGFSVRPRAHPSNQIGGEKDARSVKKI